MKIHMLSISVNTITYYLFIKYQFNSKQYKRNILQFQLKISEIQVVYIINEFIYENTIYLECYVMLIWQKIKDINLISYTTDKQ